MQSPIDIVQNREPLGDEGGQVLAIEYGLARDSHIDRRGVSQYAIGGAHASRDPLCDDGWKVLAMMYGMARDSHKDGRWLSQSAIGGAHASRDPLAGIDWN